MRLSEAIMLGSSIHPQGFGQYSQTSGILRTIKTCAWGAAFDAVGISIINNEELSSPEPEEWAWSDGECKDVPCRCNFERYSRFPAYASIIVHLNDTHRWTRERIAEWVATVEPQETPEEKREIVEAFCEQLVNR